MNTTTKPANIIQVLNEKSKQERMLKYATVLVTLLLAMFFSVNVNAQGGKYFNNVDDKGGDTGWV